MNVEETSELEETLIQEYIGCIKGFVNPEIIDTLRNSIVDQQLLEPRCLDSQYWVKTPMTALGDALCHNNLVYVEYLLDKYGHEALQPPGNGFKRWRFAVICHVTAEGGTPFLEMLCRKTRPYANPLSEGKYLDNREWMTRFFQNSLYTTAMNGNLASLRMLLYHGIPPVPIDTTRLTVLQKCLTEERVIPNMVAIIQTLITAQTTISEKDRRMLVQALDEGKIDISMTTLNQMSSWDINSELSPPPLSHLAKSSIRRSPRIMVGLPQTVNLLPLPRVLKKYIAMGEFM